MGTAVLPELTLAAPLTGSKNVVVSVKCTHV